MSPARRATIPPERVRAQMIAEAERTAGAQSKSIVRGLALLEGFAGDMPVLGIAEMADIAGFNRSTAHRYMATLTELGYLTQDRASRKYRLGPRCADLGVAALECSGLRRHHDLLQGLRRRCGWTATLAALNGERALIVDVARSHRERQGELTLSMRPGVQLPLHSTALGKALLSAVPKAERRATLDRLDLSKLTPATIDSRRTLTAAIEQVGSDGFAREHAEHDPLLHALAAPVAVSRIAAPVAIGIAVHDPEDEGSSLAQELGAQLLQSAEDLAAAMRLAA